MKQRPQLHPRTLPKGVGPKAHGNNVTPPARPDPGKTRKEGMKQVNKANPNNKTQLKGNVTGQGKPANNRTTTGRDTKFKPGVSGNPAGRPKGSKDKWGKGIIDRFKDREEELSQAALEAAIKDGKVPAMAMILDRLAAKADSQPIRFKPVTNLQTADDICKEQQAIVSAVYQGELTPRQAETLQRILETYAVSIREAQQTSVRERFERDERLLAKARNDPQCLAAASAFVTRLHTLDMPAEAWQHPAIQAAVAVAEGA